MSYYLRGFSCGILTLWRISRDLYYFRIIKGILLCRISKGFNYVVSLKAFIMSYYLRSFSCGILTLLRISKDLNYAVLLKGFYNVVSLKVLVMSYHQRPILCHMIKGLRIVVSMKAFMMSYYLRSFSCRLIKSWQISKGLYYCISYHKGILWCCIVKRIKAFLIPISMEYYYYLFY